ncbi:MAG: hypothetical protein ACRESE_02185 [Gammaproteobacteria bacterium]
MYKISMKSVFLALAITLLAGCATLANHEHAKMLKLAVQDDQSCQAQGLRYPEPRYVTCRMQLDDKRQYRSWMDLQLMHQTNYQNPSAAPVYPYREIYRPLDREHFHCHYVTENAQDYILCSEDAQS